MRQRLEYNWLGSEIMSDTESQFIKVREDLAEVKTDVKHVLLHLERQNGRIGRLEEDVDKNKSEVTKAKTIASVFAGTISMIVSLFISNRP